MDALVQAALEKVNDEVAKANPDKAYYSDKVRKAHIARAINAVDALKSALKAL